MGKRGTATGNEIETRRFLLPQKPPRLPKISFLPSFLPHSLLSILTPESVTLGAGLRGWHCFSFLLGSEMSLGRKREEEEGRGENVTSCVTAGAALPFLFSTKKSGEKKEDQEDHKRKRDPKDNGPSFLRTQKNGKEGEVDAWVGS